MWHLEYVLLLLFLVINGFICHGSIQNLTGNGRESVHVNESCKMLSINRFQLDLSCILQAKPSSVVHKLRTSSLEKCKEICCSYWEGSCDMVYWNNRHDCYVMNYYVLNFCSIYSLSHPSSIYSSSLLLSVSNRVPTSSKKLLLKSYRQKVQRLLGCGLDKFVCDNWSCISRRYYCDKSVHCSDGSDETQCSHSGQQQCLGFDGAFYDPGDEYTPYDVQDSCKKCICGNNSSPLYCYSALCDPNLLTRCKEPYEDICCRCHMLSPPPDGETTDLSTTQRLVVSCMAVLGAVSLLLYFSGNLSRARHASRRSDEVTDSRDEGLQQWYPPNPPGCPRNRSFFSRYLPQNQSVSFFDQDGLPAVFPDVPPPYNTLKPIDSEEQASLQVDPPPSYNVHSLRAAGTPSPDDRSDALPTMQQVNHGASTSRPITRLYSVNEPISPLSTTSESPLLQDNTGT